ncbi:2-polyprenyl-3-methyl-5-hydroxy-6-metoxy-1,4-benzoquinol methylase [Shewanella sp. NFH-SH190041]|uniref:class I SAM-dependent methyltransferase n=1 Tax=Shewanella sp. NFH-SH190041 TaxID=2950245 RepID=UPI0021C2C75B|nr:class I SAM-dependent methyltransferase [Shewanella sp. NFH-SH190041]BDM65954.1 2-polyprenyl-3-methyl-5-hydroxy-6-metoxy-1,4-benzoquinol methylase [Shewanella sp. NFH-SH190041]
MSRPSPCPLCHYATLKPFAEDKRRHYMQCPCCHLVSVPPQYHLSCCDEKAEYDKHDNHAADAGYIRFLRRCWDPVFAWFQARGDNLTTISGLDFGCGEGAVMSRIAAADGITLANYDLYYHPESTLLQQQYQLILMTEVIEHIADAAALVRQLDTMLLPDGLLAVMTKRVQDKNAFARWHYKNDPTHICFYAMTTFQWLADELGWQLIPAGTDVVLLHKPKG